MEKRRCMSCFREIEADICPHCGYPANTKNESHQLPIGTMLRGRYRIGRVLGQGGFGITYLAWDTLMQNTVAVKEFFPDGTVYRKCSVSTHVECVTDKAIPHYEYSRERFLREASALVKFKEIPEVVDILDFSEENNTAYIVMEFVRGVDMAKYIQRKGGKLSVDETFRILKPVMEALAKVHKGGIVHRDISPDNIILDPMGGAKLLDFGAVRAVENPDVEKGLNKSTEAILKQGFAPIEQYNSRGSLGPWTDEYAMCATIWYCLTGRIPEEASIRVSEGIDPDWSTLEGLPEHQQKALQKGISCRAKDRYPSMDALLEALFPEEDLPQEEKVPEPVKKEDAPKPAKEERAPEPVPEIGYEPKPDAWKKKRKLPWILGAAAAIVILVTAMLLLTAPARRYAQAEELLVKGSYQEAIAIFEELGGYQDSADRIPECHYRWAEAALEAGNTGEAAIRFGKLSDHRDARARSLALWDQIAVRETVSVGGSYTMGLRVDGTVVAVGRNDYGQCDVSQWTDIVAVSAGWSHTVGLRADGTVVAVGSNMYGQRDVSQWTDIVAVSAGGNHTVGLRADGTVVAVGYNGYGECDVSQWTDIVAVSAGGGHTVGLRADGTVVAVGSNEYGQCDVSQWTDIVAVSAGWCHTVGLRADGTVVAVGWNGSGQCDVSDWKDIRLPSKPVPFR